MSEEYDVLREDLAHFNLWKNHPVTLEVLKVLEDEYRANTSKVLFDLAPSTLGLFFEREQSIGECRGLDRLRTLIENKQSEFEQRLKETVQEEQDGGRTSE